MPDTKFGCMPTIIGSMPHTDPSEACSQITRFLKDIPAWPQLPKRSFLENMYAQYSEGFPGVVIEGDRIYIDRAQDLIQPMEQFYNAYLQNDFDKFAIGQDYAAGLNAFLKLDISPRIVKGQVTGPVSWGLTVTDKDKRSILYDDVLSDAVARLLKMKAGWQERELSRISRNTIIFVDEPYMTSFGSAYISLSRDKVISLLNEVFSGISGLKGIHCCGNTDWSVLLATSTDIINFDTYNFTQSLGLYPVEVKRFLDRGGAIAWGIIPNDPSTLAGETVASLKDRLEEAMATFTRNGVPFRQLIEQGLLTPSCTLTTLSEDEAGQALEVLTGLSQTMRKRYL
ncbi:methionine synthase [Chloroflexota bacterium]